MGGEWVPGRVLWAWVGQWGGVAGAALCLPNRRMEEEDSDGHQRCDQQAQKLAGARQRTVAIIMLLTGFVIFLVFALLCVDSTVFKVLHSVR